MFATLPVTALRSFEAAARLLSFKLAAAELAVTATAVSHQVKALERHVGYALFERVPRGVRLTEKGARLFAAVHGALLDVAQTLDALRAAPASGALTVSTTHSFAALWLVPRLGRFHAAFPQYQLNLNTSPEPVDLLRDASMDLAIRYSRERWPGLHAACSLQEWFGVYGAPALAARPGRRAPSLVTVRWRDSQLYDRSWQDWCEAAGLPSWRKPAAVHAYEEEHYALQAAIAGQGLVLASSVMVSDSVAAGTLVPYRPDVRVAGAAYTALCAPGRERHPPLRAFLGWLRQEFEART
ncbi:LysR family transcriptional regulator [Achromobacter pestifer]|uniref:LysR family transcriptional regulator n=1 Tax=Achromobacter pestifer TaxID=1353889 RepID=A0A7D4HNE9_9BURK|nr:LysR substrate-binding domain-containing protein [Achromobacter pestifer]QKH33599.1 LysR family transcriptional regulator [Achromobacter pestifer]